MAMTAGDRGKIKSDINVTPLVDVVLVLLIIFMVVTPLLQRGKSVTLPPSRIIDKESKSGDPLILSITPDKKVWVDKDKFDDAGLEQKLRDEVIANPYRPILVKGDRSITVGDVRKVMAIARKAGARGVQLAVEQIKTAS
ncbi:MAG TPA: biopolymer transporter ExbD [Anaeromyxobacteraceae bacterium]|nr:biopolymer transporter ExbD [Anaeromyxobacteraceae bacterium]